MLHINFESAQNVKRLGLSFRFALAYYISFIHFCSTDTKVNIRGKRNMDPVFLSYSETKHILLKLHP